MWNQINQFHEFFLARFHFFQFQKWLKINFWTGKKFKKVWAKKLVKSNKSISWKFQNPFLVFFKNGQKSIFELGNSLKFRYFPWKLKFYLIFMENIQKKNFFVKLIYLISQVFWSGLFLIFWPTMDPQSQTYWSLRVSFALKTSSRTVGQLGNYLCIYLSLSHPKTYLLGCTLIDRF